MLQLKKLVKVFKGSSNSYYTNTGCLVLLYIRDGSRRALISSNELITYDEIKAIRYALLNRSRNYYIDIDNYTDNYGNQVELREMKTKPKYAHGHQEIVKSETVKSHDTGESYKLLITLDGGVETHMSVARDSEEYISLNELSVLRSMHLPSDKKFGMFFPPEEEFVNVHQNCFHLIEILNN